MVVELDTGGCSLYLPVRRRISGIHFEHFCISQKEFSVPNLILYGSQSLSVSALVGSEVFGNFIDIKLARKLGVSLQEIINALDKLGNRSSRPTWNTLSWHNSGNVFHWRSQSSGDSLTQSPWSCNTLEARCTTGLGGLVLPQVFIPLLLSPHQWKP